MALCPAPRGEREAAPTKTRQRRCSPGAQMVSDTFHDLQPPGAARATGRRGAQAEGPDARKGPPFQTCGAGRGGTEAWGGGTWTPPRPCPLAVYPALIRVYTEPSLRTLIPGGGLSCWTETGRASPRSRLGPRASDPGDFEAGPPSPKPPLITSDYWGIALAEGGQGVDTRPGSFCPPWLSRRGQGG